MIIRMAKESDIPGIICLLRQVGEVHRQIRPDLFRGGAQKYDENALARLLEDEDRPVFVAAEEGLILGYCFCIRRKFHGDSVMTDRREIYIDDLCVDENHRGSGIAAKLYRHVCGWAKEDGWDYITLNVWSGNDGAMKFYEKMGLMPRSITMEAKL